MSRSAERERMVNEQLIGRGIRDPRVLEAMRRIPRERFIDLHHAPEAYEDRPLSIGHGQTISQPYVVARTCELARIDPGSRVLEVGAGCGYQTCILCALANEVFAVEIIPELADRARKNLEIAGVRNALVECFDGASGWRAHAPYDAIVVAAGAPDVPPLLVDQLADGGRLVLPLGPRDAQRLVVVTRRGASYTVASDIQVRFVDLTGRFGYEGAGAPKA